MKRASDASSPAVDADTVAAQIEDLRARHRQLLQRIDAGEARFRTLARSVWRVQEEERRRIARELHDGIGQNLTALKHTLALLGSRSGHDAELRAGVEDALSLCSRTLQDTRELSRLLRPQILDDLGLAAALNWLARSIERADGPQVEIEYALGQEPDNELRTLLFRIVQEALTNVSRHSRASHAVVRLGERDGCATLLVWDDGVGCDPAAAFAAASEGRSAGLAGMRERLRLHAGDLQFESAPGQGTRVRCTLPLGNSGEAP